MRIIVLGFCFATVAAPALAVEVIMDGYKPWVLITNNDRGADAIDIDQVQSQGEFRRIYGVHYYPATIQFSVMKDGRPVPARADFVLGTTDIDCRSTGTYRLRNEEYYTVNNADPSWTYKHSYIVNGTARWSTATRDSPQYVIWQVLCKGATPSGMIGLDKIVGKRFDISHSAVLSRIRNQIQHQK